MDKLSKIKEDIRKKREKDPEFFKKLKSKIKKIKKEDPNIYPMN